MVGLILTGPQPLCDICVNAVRFPWRIFQHHLKASMGKVTPSMDAAARTLGAKPRRAALRKVHTPIMPAAVCWPRRILVFVDVNEGNCLPRSFLRPFQFPTPLPLRCLQSSGGSDERLAESATSSLFTVAVGIIPVVILSLQCGHSRPGAAHG